MIKKLTKKKVLAMVKKAKAFCPTCRKMTKPKKNGYLTWCGSCGDPID
jgi:NADH pyrophosphatase NudC (nudix superfamily)